MWLVSMPAIVLNNSAIRWLLLPLPYEPNASAPGLALASAIRSAALFTGTSLLATSKVGADVTKATGTKSRSGS